MISAFAILGNVVSTTVVVEPLEGVDTQRIGGGFNLKTELIDDLCGACSVLARPSTA